MKPTDMSEKGLESLIVEAMTGVRGGTLHINALSFEVRRSARRKSLGSAVQRDGSHVVSASLECPVARSLAEARGKRRGVYCELATWRRCGDRNHAHRCYYRAFHCPGEDRPAGPAGAEVQARPNLCHDFASVGSNKDETTPT